MQTNGVSTVSAAILAATQDAMRADASLVCFGLGVTDPKGVFGTTLGLTQEFGQRVFDVPASENALTGLAIGMALGGAKILTVHQRFEFFLLAMDQLVNSAAKWHFMFGGRHRVPITIRLVVGRGWGQGPTHSQSLHAWLTHIPGIVVVTPSSPQDAYDLLRGSLVEGNPVVFLEHRWIHAIRGPLVRKEGPWPIKSIRNDPGCKVVRRGNDITIVAWSYYVVEARKAARVLRDLGIEVEIVDVYRLNPLDLRLIQESLTRTRKLLVLDFAATSGSFGSDLISRIFRSSPELLGEAPKLLAHPDIAEPTSLQLLEGFHVTAKRIVEAVCDLDPVELNLIMPDPISIDTPDAGFDGPF